MAGLLGKHVVVIGGSQGMGLAVARAAQADGARLTLVSRSAEKLAAAARALGGEVATRAVDVSDGAQVEALFGALGPLDHLVMTQASAMEHMAPFRHLPVEAARAAFEIKFWGQYRCAHAAAARMGAGGSVTFFSGVAAERHFEGLVAFAAINGAINALVRTLAVDLKPIRVNAISPGVMATEAFDIMPEEARAGFFGWIGERAPAGRVGRGEDVAEAARYLMLAEYATGTVVTVDGGIRVA
jgi:NAD(P)-dependent dehydrogenase (short-subunit alcohol dehydrogenase family)